MGEVERCNHCDYDLRGSDTEVCPECGAPRVWRKLRFFDRGHFLQALTVLGQAGIAATPVEATGFLEHILGGGNPPLPEILIGRQDTEPAIEALEAAGIGVPLPIVDRSEPVCPECGTELDLGGPEQCPTCRLAFHWVEVAP